MSINEELFAGFDLNLMVVFLVLYREQSVSAAAKRLNVGQPAVSGSLCRLRQRFNDSLFVRHGRGVRPTPRAEQIAKSLAPSIRKIELILSLTPAAEQGPGEMGS
jgi:DNA-binding transcriptional LysR family regulator